MYHCQKVRTMKTASNTRLKIADEVWIATALLHREHPDQPDFSVEEIVDRAVKEQAGDPLRPGLYVHVIQHCVANRAPNPARSRILFETRPGRRRLFRKGDSYHPRRRDSKTVPRFEDLPERYVELFSWYNKWSSQAEDSIVERDPLLLLAGSGKDIWADESADEYVRRLREGWE